MSDYKEIGDNVGAKIQDGVLTLETLLTANVMTGKKTASGNRVIATAHGGGMIDLGLVSPDYLGYTLTYRVTKAVKKRHGLD